MYKEVTLYHFNHSFEYMTAQQLDNRPLDFVNMDESSFQIKYGNDTLHANSSLRLFFLFYVDLPSDIMFL